MQQVLGSEGSEIFHIEKYPEVFAGRPCSLSSEPGTAVSFYEPVAV